MGSPVRVPPSRQSPLQTLYHDIFVARRTSIEMLPGIDHHINGAGGLQSPNPGSASIIIRTTRIASKVSKAWGMNWIGHTRGEANESPM